MPENKKTNKNKKRKNSQNRNSRYSDPSLWKPGDPLTKEDEAMLNVVRRRYEQLGYTPTRKEVPTAGILKKRFRIWSDVILAAGLPAQRESEQVQKRMKAKEWERNMRKLMGGGE